MPCVVRWAEPDDVVELPILPAEGRIVEIGDLLPEEDGIWSFAGQTVAASLGIHRNRSWFAKLFGGRAMHPGDQQL